MATLNKAQKEGFWRDGYLVVEGVVDAALLRAMQDDFSNWIGESRGYSEPYGETINERPRFDLEPGHRADKPGLRRVNAPVEVSDAYYQTMTSNRMTDCVADLIGPNIKFHHSKINSKLPGGETAVKWHQDFPFTLHSNDDIMENGPLEVVPGSHKEKIHGPVA